MQDDVWLIDLCNQSIMYKTLIGHENMLVVKKYNWLFVCNFIACLQNLFVKKAQTCTYKYVTFDSISGVMKGNPFLFTKCLSQIVYNITIKYPQNYSELFSVCKTSFKYSIYKFHVKWSSMLMCIV